MRRAQFNNSSTSPAVPLFEYEIRVKVPALITCHIEILSAVPNTLPSFSISAQFAPFFATGGGLLCNYGVFSTFAERGNL